jgi:hypothetical protein
MSGHNNIFATANDMAIRNQQLAMMLEPFAHACPDLKT